MDEAAAATSDPLAISRSEESPEASASTSAGHIEVLEVMSDLLSGVGEGSPPDAFFSSLCEAIWRLTSVRRAVLFRYASLST
jgi:hypothetical protein